MNKLEPIYSIPYLDKGFVEYYDLSELLLDDNNIPFIVAHIATLSYGNEYAKNPLQLYEKLIQNKHESVLEFVRYPYIDESDNTVKGYSIQDSLRHKGALIDKNKRDPNLFRKTIFTFKVKIPIFVARQLMRHRCFSYLELSRRYVTNKKVDFEFYIPDEIKSNEQLYNEYINYINILLELYKKQIENKIKPEIARAILPLSLYTQIWMQGDIYCINNFLNLRLSEHAQREIRLLASIIKDIVDKVCDTKT